MTSEPAHTGRPRWASLLWKRLLALTGREPVSSTLAATPGSIVARGAFDHALSAVISALPDPVVVLDRQGIVVALNAPARELAPALRAGEHASFALRVPALVEAVREVTASGQAQRVEFSERVPIDRWHEVWVVPAARAAAPTTEFELLLLTFHDLTPLHRVEEMRADFIANASHELRTPLASLSGFIETLQGSARNDPKAQGQFLAIMKTQADRMARLIDDLLSLSRIELNAHRPPEALVDVVPLLHQVKDSLHTLASDRAVEIAIDTPAEPATVVGDRDELIRVFENLVENALKYGAAGKRVDVAVHRTSADESRPEILVSVRDYGVGITPEHLPRLTERFYRVDVGQSRSEGGTGLGLALVKHILNRHRGRLVIESTPGAGATFTARLPLFTGSQPS